MLTAAFGWPAWTDTEVPCARSLAAVTVVKRAMASSPPLSPRRSISMIPLASVARAYSGDAVEEDPNAFPTKNLLRRRSVAGQGLDAVAAQSVEVDHRRQKKEIKNADLYYNPNEPLKNLLRWHGTALRMTLTSAPFWIIMVVYGLFATLARFDYTPDTVWILPRVDSDQVGLASSFMTFFVVFFSGESYTRYFRTYFNTQAVIGRVTEMTLFIRSDFPGPSHQALRARLVRFMHAAHHLSYYLMPQFHGPHGLRAGYLRYMVQIGILTKVEANQLWKLRDLGCSREPLFWFLATINEAHTAGLINESQIFTYRGNVTSYRRLIADVHDVAFEPIPLPFYHHMQLLITLFLLWLSYASAYIQGWGIGLLLLIVIAILGLRDVSNQMADPFGLDEIDLPISEYISSVYLQHRKLVDEPVPPQTDEFSEHWFQVSDDDVRREDAGVMARRMAQNVQHQRQVELEQKLGRAATMGEIHLQKTSSDGTLGTEAEPSFLSRVKAMFSGVTDVLVPQETPQARARDRQRAGLQAETKVVEPARTRERHATMSTFDDDDDVEDTLFDTQFDSTPLPEVPQ